ncbi:MAG: signal recognition particle-docking protein FtsY [Coriobacteriales bacterium]|jgi:fused signal recognition particle receptor|nr:signal recognition particle-docking protein FtsY [Coriobacteriales bacterium]
MSWLDKLSEGLTRTRERFNEQLNVILDRTPALDDDFWDDLEETLITSDFGAPATLQIIDQLQDSARRLALPDARAVLNRMAQTIAGMFTQAENDLFALPQVCVLFVGINGSGKTTTVGKLAKEASDNGRRVLLGSADTFRAAAIEQLDIWAKRANVEVVKRERGADPASVSYEVIERAEASNANCILIDTAGRLHTSDDLMRELEKVVAVTRKRAIQWQTGTKTNNETLEVNEIDAQTSNDLAVKTVLVIDATTGQNGLQQAREFNSRLDLDGVIITKLDGTAKGGIAVAISHELKIPVLRIGVGEKIDDLRPFNALDFSTALIEFS